MKTCWLLLAFGFAATGCALIGVFSSPSQPFGFNHAVHFEEGLECGDCHMAWETEESPGIPPRGGCDLCHEDIDAEKPPERRIDQLFDGDSYKAQRVSKLDDEVIFSHLQHATKPVECTTCHNGIETNTYVDSTLALRMSDCESCHAQESVANDCAACHQRLRTDVAPDSHLFSWTKVHGPTVRAQHLNTANNCSMCHQESSCTTCHQSTPPENHNNFFRRRGHGLHARMDRQSCAACHRSDSCDTCHQETRPINHTGAFSGTLNTHCMGCHLPLQDSECGTCHQGAPSHALATPLPAGHTLAMNCRMCHGAGQPQPHVDNGMSCTSCHR